VIGELPTRPIPECHNVVPSLLRSASALAAESPLTFFSRDVSAQVTFVKDAAGKVTGLTLSMGGGELPAQKVK